VGIFLPRVTLILGGAASGKSRFAERLVLGTGLPKTYIATAQAFDEEMAHKIRKHVADRGDGWVTVEEPLDVPEAIGRLAPGSAALMDCATLWLSNALLAEQALSERCDALVQAVATAAGPLVIVSNEVGQGIVPDTKLGRDFRAAQGRLNQDLAARADLVVLVVAGLPLVLKGALPEGLP
jgi:adenosylcobinamide kinase/adenosylcobinamide-phosphate guanylyltransferase